LQSTEISHVVQLAVAPVFLLTGVGTTLNVLAARIARIIDRARAQEQMLATAEDRVAQDIRVRLKALARRARLINRAMALCVVSALLVSLVVVALFVSATLSVDLGLPIAAGFVVALLCLTLALLLFLREVFIATSALRFGEPDDGI
jgi:hypothetical protein